MRLAPLVLLAACSDYGVAHSELAKDAESAEIALAADGATELLLRLSADGDALGGSPSDHLELTTFALATDGPATVKVTASIETAEAAVTATAFVEMTLTGLLGACDADSEHVLVTTALPGGGCEVELPVVIASMGGASSVQLTGHFEVGFPSQDPPGSIDLVIE